MSESNGASPQPPSKWDGVKHDLDPVSVVNNIAEDCDALAGRLMDRLIGVGDPDASRYNHNWKTVILFRSLMIRCSNLEARVEALENQEDEADDYLTKESGNETRKTKEAIRELNGHEDTGSGEGSDQQEA